MDANLIQGKIIPTEWLAGTDWQDFEDPIIGTLVPNSSASTLGKIFPMATSTAMR